MKKITFYKTFKKATALALIFAVSYPASVSATRVTYSIKEHINEGDSLTEIARRGMTLSIRGDAMFREGNQASRTEVIPYLAGAQAAEEDLKEVRNTVVGSPLLAYSASYKDHQTSFERIIRRIYKDTHLSQCNGDLGTGYRDQAEELSDKLFKAALNQLSQSYRENQWSEDKDLQTFITFIRNKDGKVCVFIKGLDIALPLYKNHRLSNLNSYTPSGSSLTSEEQKSAYLTNQLLMKYPDALRKGFKYLLKNKNTSEEDFFKFITGNNIVQLSRNIGISSQDQTWLGQHILPYLYQSCVQEKDKYYNNIGNFLTSEGLSHSKYKPGMNIADYLEYWSKRWGMPGHFEKTFPGIYQEGLEEKAKAKAKDFGISESDYTALSKHILPYLYKSCVHAKDKYYNNMWNFLTPEGLRHSGYKPGMNMADYLTYWSDRWKEHKGDGHFEKTFSEVYKTGLEEKAEINKQLENFMISDPKGSL
jgi:hypothetical protein